MQDFRSIYGSMMQEYVVGPNVYHNGAPNDRYTVQYTYFDEWGGLIDEFVDCIRNHKQPKNQPEMASADHRLHECLLRERAVR